MNPSPVNIRDTVARTACLLSACRNGCGNRAGDVRSRSPDRVLAKD